MLEGQHGSVEVPEANTVLQGWNEGQKLGPYRIQTLARSSVCVCVAQHKCRFLTSFKNNLKFRTPAPHSSWAIHQLELTQWITSLMYVIHSLVCCGSVVGNQLASLSPLTTLTSTDTGVSALMLEGRFPGNRLQIIRALFQSSTFSYSSSFSFF